MEISGIFWRLLGYPLPRETQEVMEAAAIAVGCGSDLAGNPGITEETWFKLYTTKPKVKAEVAKDLVSRHLTPEQTEHVLKYERRIGVVTAFLLNNVLDVERLTGLLHTVKLSDDSLNALIAHYRDDLGAIRSIAFAAKGLPLLSWISQSTPDDLSDSELLDLLRDFAVWGPTANNGKEGRPRRSALLALFERRPISMEAVTAEGQHPSFLDVTASSRRLVDPAHQRVVSAIDEPDAAREVGLGKYLFRHRALVHNPVVSTELVRELRDWATTALEELRKTEHNPSMLSGLVDLVDTASFRLDRHPVTVTDPYEEVADPLQLQWLLSRSLPSEYNGRAGKPWDMFALARNPHLSKEQADRLAIGINSTACLAHAGITRAEHQDAIRRFCEQYPESAATIALAPDDASVAAVGGTGSTTTPPPQSVATVSVSRKLLEVLGDGRPEVTQVDDFDERQCVLASSVTRAPTSVSELATAAQLADEYLGTDMPSWEIALTMSNEFVGTYGELLETARFVGTGSSPGGTDHG